MAYSLQMGGYVKFLRGTPKAWESLTTKDPDTLYFISEKDAKVGSLYLGDKLISSGIAPLSNLTDMEDISVGDSVADNSLLVFDEESGKWVDKTITEVIFSENSNLAGASDEEDGVSGFVPAPLRGQQDLFLKGDGTWADPGVSEQKERIDSFIGTDEGKTAREIAQEEIDKTILDIESDSLEVTEENKKFSIELTWDKF